MELKEHLRRQLEEALGPVNRWYCSQSHGYEVTDPNALLAYYIRHGGAANARARSVGSASATASAIPARSSATERQWMSEVHGVAVADEN